MTQPKNRNAPGQLKWLLALLAALFVAYSVANVWLWRESTLVRGMLASTQNQLHECTRLLLHQRYLLESDNPIAANTASTTLQDSAKRLWSAHWANARGEYSALINRSHASVLRRYYQNAQDNLDTRIESVLNRSEQLSVDEEGTPISVAAIEQIENQLQQIQAYLIARERTLGNRNTMLTLLSIPATALLAALLYYTVILPLRTHSENNHDALTKAQANLQSLARKDPLTNVANRSAITGFLSTVANGQIIDGEFIALAVLDIDHFSHINDVFGYFAGDSVLQTVAARIVGELRDEDKLGRLDADHFAIVLRHLPSPRDAERIIERIQQVVCQTVDYKDNPISISCTIGASAQEMQTLDLAELFKLTDKALNQAQQNQRGSALLLSNQAQAAISRQREILNRLMNRPPNEVFDIVYQPIVSLHDHSIAGCECLLRWRESSPANLFPEEFIPILEMYGEIKRTGEWILTESLDQLKHWQEVIASTKLFLSVNLSALQLEANDYAQNVIRETEKRGLAPGSISLELTETAAIKYLETGRKQMSLLRTKGFGISLDDFGTGYSSLQYLKTMPATTVKIDKIFIQDMLSDQRDAAIVESAIRISAAMGLNVVAEGVENQAQADQLAAMNCSHGQGYFFSPPVTASEFEDLLRTSFQIDPANYSHREQR